MEINTFRGYILIRHKTGLRPIEFFNELRLASPDNSPSYLTVTGWISRFKEGIEDLQDFQRPGRSITHLSKH